MKKLALAIAVAAATILSAKADLISYGGRGVPGVCPACTGWELGANTENFWNNTRIGGRLLDGVTIWSAPSGTSIFGKFNHEFNQAGHFTLRYRQVGDIQFADVTIDLKNSGTVLAGFAVVGPLGGETIYTLDSFDDIITQGRFSLAGPDHGRWQPPKNIDHVSIFTCDGQCGPALLPDTGSTLALLAIGGGSTLLLGRRRCTDS